MVSSSDGGVGGYEGSSGYSLLEGVGWGFGAVLVDEDAVTDVAECEVPEEAVACWRGAVETANSYALECIMWWRLSVVRGVLFRFL